MLRAASHMRFGNRAAKSFSLRPSASVASALRFPLPMTSSAKHSIKRSNAPRRGAFERERCERGFQITREGGIARTTAGARHLKPTLEHLRARRTFVREWPRDQNRFHAFPVHERDEQVVHAEELTAYGLSCRPSLRKATKIVAVPKLICAVLDLGGPDVGYAVKRSPDATGKGGDANGELFERRRHERRDQQRQRRKSGRGRRRRALGGAYQGRILRIHEKRCRGTATDRAHG